MKIFKILSLVVFIGVLISILESPKVSAEEISTEVGIAKVADYFDPAVDNITDIEDNQTTTNEDEAPFEELKVEKQVISPMNLEDLKEVSSWLELRKAIEEGYTNLKVTANVTANNMILIKKDTMIDFGGNKITSILFNSSYWGELIVSADVNLTVRNFEYGAPATDAKQDFITGAGSVTLQGEVKISPGHNKGFIRMVNSTTTDSGTIIFDGTIFNYKSSGYRVPLIAKGLVVTNGAQVQVESSRIYAQHSSLPNLRGLIVIDKGSTMITKSVAKGSDVAAANAWSTNASDITVKDPDTKLLISGNGVGEEANAGIFVISGEKSFVNVQNYGILEINSTGSSALLMNSKNGVFNVDGHSELNLKQHYANNGDLKIQPTLRFFLQGEMTFNITNQSKISILKSGGDPSPTIRMYGGNNAINVSEGSDFYVKNVGNGIAQNPGVTRSNAGVQYSGGDNNTFNVIGESSNVEIDAVNGAAIDAWDNEQEMGKTGYTLGVTAHEDTYFVARGNTATAVSPGVFNAKELTFKLDKVKYFDFSNRRLAGGRMFKTYNSSTFETIKSDISFWQLGDNLASNPFQTWSMVDFEFGGISLNNLMTSSSPDMKANIKSMDNYSRMTANNQTPVIEELRVPTNADKAIYGYVSVGQGKGEENRPAYIDEVTIEIGVFNISGELIETLQGKTGELEVYGDEKRAGIFKVDTINNEFLKAGHTIKVLGGWRNEESARNMVKPNDILTNSELIYDVTPPELAVIDQGSQILANMSKLTGKGEKGATVTLEINGTESPEKTVVNDEGTFELILSSELKNGDTIQLFLQDSVGEVMTVKNPPSTNNYMGNINPKEDYQYHDANFKAASKINVIGILEIRSIPEVIHFGKQVISNQTETYYPELVQGTLEISDNRGSEKSPWRLLLKQTIELSNQTIKLNDNVFYTNEFGQDKTVNLNNTVVETGQFTSDGTQNISDKWSKERGLKVVIPVEKQLKGEFAGVFSWTLENVPEN